jgi:hypothetical protein
MTLVCVGGGIIPSAGVQLDASWNLRIESTRDVLRLGAVCQSAQTGDVYYVFCGTGKRPAWLEDRPAFLKELLLPLPVVMLRRSARGFHMLSKGDWDALLLEEASGPCNATCAVAVAAGLPPDGEDVASSAPLDASDVESEASQDDSASDSTSSFEVTEEEEEGLEEGISEAELIDEACAEEG